MHGLAKIHATFDDPNLVSRAALVPVIALEATGRPIRTGTQLWGQRPASMVLDMIAEAAARTAVPSGAAKDEKRPSVRPIRPPGQSPGSR